MKILTYLANYIVGEVKENNSNEDPLDIGVRIARSLRLRSTDVESLLMGIFIAKKFGIEEDLIAEAKKTVMAMPDYEIIKKAYKKDTYSPVAKRGKI